MPVDARNINYIKALHVKQIGIALASIWVIVLIAAVGATIYREIDGPTIRTTIAESVNVASINAQLSSSNTSLTKELDSATSSNIVYQAALDDAKERIDRLTSALDASQRLNAEQWEILEAYREQFPIH